MTGALGISSGRLPRFPLIKRVVSLVPSAGLTPYIGTMAAKLLQAEADKQGRVFLLIISSVILIFIPREMFR